MNFRVYKRTATNGVERTITRTHMMMVEYPVESGLTRLEWRPGGASMAGVRYGLEARDAIMTYEERRGEGWTTEDQGGCQDDGNK